MRVSNIWPRGGLIFLILLFLLFMAGCNSETGPGDDSEAVAATARPAFESEQSSVVGEAPAATAIPPLPTETSDPESGQDLNIGEAVDEATQEEILEEEDAQVSESFTPLSLTSSAFEEGQPIPEKHSCDGENLSPQLDWTEPPPGTESFALIFDDPDAVDVVGYTWIHWTIFDLPADTRTLPEAFTSEPNLEDGSQQGMTSFQQPGYGGPCPPEGTHRYFFRLFALDTMLRLDFTSTAEDLIEAMEGHVLDQAELTGLYTR